jgi:hypothetical protein
MATRRELCCGLSCVPGSVTDLPTSARGGGRLLVFVEFTTDDDEQKCGYANDDSDVGALFQ